MIYPANFEQKIGFDRLREQVAALCTMRAARGKLAEETFSTSAREIGRRLELADQMRLLLDMEHDFPGGNIPTSTMSLPNCVSKGRSSTWGRW